MKTVALLLSLLSYTLYAESFITDLEYGELLYKNPRGIGCNLCHGEKGEGMEIAKYKSKGKNIHLEGPRINDMLYEKFVLALKKSNKIMPRYHLIEDEIKAIYLYLSEVEKKGE